MALRRRQGSARALADRVQVVAQPDRHADQLLLAQEAPFEQELRLARKGRGERVRKILHELRVILLQLPGQRTGNPNLHQGILLHLVHPTIILPRPAAANAVNKSSFRDLGSYFAP